mgnify:CR=1 FL=1
MIGSIQKPVVDGASCMSWDTMMIMSTVSESEIFHLILATVKAYRGIQPLYTEYWGLTQYSITFLYIQQQ